MPESIAYVQCAGSRDESLGVPYCSRVCCMYAIKQAMLLSGALPLADITIYYMDIRAFGKGYEQFYQNAAGHGHRVRQGQGRPHRRAARTATSPALSSAWRATAAVDEPAHDLVVLSLGMSRAPTRPCAGRGPDGDGFIKLRRPQARPTCTDRARHLRQRHRHLTQGHRRQRSSRPARPPPRWRPTSPHGWARPQRAGRSSPCRELKPRSWPRLAPSRMRTMVSDECPRLRSPTVPSRSATTVRPSAQCAGGAGRPASGSACTSATAAATSATSWTSMPWPRRLRHEAGVVVARATSPSCAPTQGQAAHPGDIRDLGLDRVIVAACTPSLHETTFRKAVIRAGMNPYLFLHANIREQVSWVHPHDRRLPPTRPSPWCAPRSAKSRLLEPLQPVRVDACQPHPRHRWRRRRPEGGALDCAAMGHGSDAHREDTLPGRAARCSWARSIPPTSRRARWSAVSSTPSWPTSASRC